MLKIIGLLIFFCRKYVLGSLKELKDEKNSIYLKYVFLFKLYFN